MARFALGMLWTLYVDESGTFAAREGSKVKLGLRVVGGLLLRGERAEHDRVAADLYSRHLGWAAATPHCAEFSVFQLGLRLRRLPKTDVPTHLLSAWKALRGRRLEALRASDPRAYELLRNEAQRLFRGLCLSTGELVERFSGHIVLSVEHDTEPTDTRYPPMLDALAELAVASLFDHREPARLAFVIEHRSDQPADLSDRIRERVLAFLSGRRAVAVSVEVVTKEGSATLAGADAVTHALGPGPKHSVPVGSGEACRSLASVKGESLRLFKTNAVLATDSVWAHREWALARERRETPSALHARLTDALNALPRGTLAFGVEGTRAAAAAFGQRKEPS